MIYSLEPIFSRYRPTMSVSRKLSCGEKVLMTSKRFCEACPVCAKQNTPSKLRLYQISWNQYVKLCENDLCLYPIMTGDMDEFAVDNKIEQPVPTSGHQEPSTMISNSALCNNGVTVLPSIPSMTPISGGPSSTDDQDSKLCAKGTSGISDFVPGEESSNICPVGSDDILHNLMFYGQTSGGPADADVASLAAMLDSIRDDADTDSLQGASSAMPNEVNDVVNSVLMDLDILPVDGCGTSTHEQHTDCDSFTRLDSVQTDCLGLQEAPLNVLNPLKEQQDKTLPSVEDGSLCPMPCTNTVSVHGSGGVVNGSLAPLLCTNTVSVHGSGRVQGGSFGLLPCMNAFPEQGHGNVQPFVIGTSGIPEELDGNCLFVNSLTAQPSGVKEMSHPQALNEGIPPRLKIDPNVAEPIYTTKILVAPVRGQCQPQNTCSNSVPHVTNSVSKVADRYAPSVTKITTNPRKTPSSRTNEQKGPGVMSTTLVEPSCQEDAKHPVENVCTEIAAMLGGTECNVNASPEIPCHQIPKPRSKLLQRVLSTKQKAVVAVPVVRKTETPRTMEKSANQHKISGQNCSSQSPVPSTVLSVGGTCNTSLPVASVKNCNTKNHLVSSWLSTASLVGKTAFAAYKSKDCDFSSEDSGIQSPRSLTSGESESCVTRA